VEAIGQVQTYRGMRLQIQPSSHNHTKVETTYYQEDNHNVVIDCKLLCVESCSGCLHLFEKTVVLVWFSLLYSGTRYLEVVDVYFVRCHLIMSSGVGSLNFTGKCHPVACCWMN